MREHFPIDPLEGMSMRKQSLAAAAPAALIGIGVLAGCASHPPAPVAQLTRARTLVTQAQTSDAPRYDSVDLTAAQDKLQQADANAQSDPVAAGQFAQEASAMRSCRWRARARARRRSRWGRSTTASPRCASRPMDWAMTPPHTRKALPGSQALSRMCRRQCHRPHRENSNHVDPHAMDQG